MTTEEKYKQALENLKRPREEPKLETKQDTTNDKLMQVAQELSTARVTETELKQFKDEQKEPIKDLLEEDDDRFQYDAFGNKVRKIHNNTKRRKSIEARSSKLTIEDLLINNYVKQSIPLIPDKLVVEFRSLSGDDISFISSKIWEKQMSPMHRSVRQLLYNLTAALERINNERLPDCRKNGELDEALFNEKYKRIKKISFELLSDYSVNYIWFTERVQELSVDPENIINF